MLQEQVQAALRSSHSIAIIGVGGIGDALYALPFNSAFRTAYPDAHITLITTQPKMGALLQSRGLIDEVAAVRSPAGLALEQPGLRRRASLWLAFLKATWALRRRRFDASIFLPTGVTRGLGIWQVSIGARLKIGMGDPVFANLFDYLVTEPLGHQIDRHVVLADALGCAPGVPDEAYRRFFSPITSDAVRHNDVVLHPFLMSPVRDGRAWSLDRFGTVHDALVDAGVAVTVVGTSAELVHPALARWRRPKTVALGSIEESARLLAGARLVIGNDSAVVHLGELVGTLALIIGGSSDPSRTAPRFRGDFLRLDLPCSPCFFHRGYVTCTHYSCVEQLPPALVLEHPLMQDILQDPAGSSEREKACHAG